VNGQSPAKKFAKKISNITHMRDALCKLFGLEVLGEGVWLKTLRLEDCAPRKGRPGSLQQSLLPYHEAWS
jgi:hypothetical protein